MAGGRDAGVSSRTTHCPWGLGAKRCKLDKALLSLVLRDLLVELLWQGEQRITEQCITPCLPRGTAPARRVAFVLPFRSPTLPHRSKPSQRNGELHVLLLRAVGVQQVVLLCRKEAPPVAAGFLSAQLAACHATESKGNLCMTEDATCIGCFHSSFQKRSRPW